MTSTTYVHGYTPREAQRLLDQAGTLAELFHHDTAYPPGSRVLEAGCGVGAQTVELARRSPGQVPGFLSLALRRLLAGSAPSAPARQGRGGEEGANPTQAV
jgi:tRNA G46 methylase TrmB